MPFRFAVLLCFSQLCLCANTGTAHYLGPGACAECHRDVAAIQTKTAMAQTWRGTGTSSLPLKFDARIAETSDPPLFYEIERAHNGFVYATGSAGAMKLSIPVEVVVGGKRHGLGFLVRMGSLGGIPLQRAPLIQARYFWSFAREALVLAPGVPQAKSRSYETSMGLVLSPEFEKKCLTCHGQPNTLGAGADGGVHCETCHGPGSEHLDAVTKGRPHSGVINPKKLSGERSIAVCAPCHKGFGRHIDPTPEDLLIANQVDALQNSECFIQSGAGLTCTRCHNPHRDSATDLESAQRACLGCHSIAAKPHAGICPVNSSGGCIGCHMPSVEMGPLRLVDHWIRVHPEQGVKASNYDRRVRSEVPALREYLRIIVTNNRAAAEAARDRLTKGESFYALARNVSSDPTASVGGYLGRKWLSQMEPTAAAAAATLAYGETSGIVESGGKWILLQRLPRDFRWEAEEAQREANELLTLGDRTAAIEKAQQALMIYPAFLRSLRFIGSTLAEAGSTQRASEVLKLATHLYSEDASAVFSYGVTLGALGRRSEEMDAYRRAIQLEPDFVAAYEKLGMALYRTEQWQSAIEVFRQGLQINPLSAELNYGLGLTLLRTGSVSAGTQAMALAKKIDPDFTW